MNPIQNGLFALALVGFASHAAPNASPALRFRVTVSNSTAGNGLSPFLAVVLKNGNRLFEVGKPASIGIATVAETGDTAPLETELAQSTGVVATAKAAGGPIPAAGSASVEISLPLNAVKAGASLHLVSMIGRSNDSFVALQGLSLANVARAGSVKLVTTNFDAGSEENTGLLADFGAGGHPVSAAEGHVSYDRGLNPRGDAPDLLAWGSVAATVTVERIK